MERLPKRHDGKKRYEPQINADERRLKKVLSAFIRVHLRLKFFPAY